MYRRGRLFCYQGGRLPSTGSHDDARDHDARDHDAHDDAHDAHDAHDDAYSRGHESFFYDGITRDTCSCEPASGRRRSSSSGGCHTKSIYIHSIASSARSKRSRFCFYSDRK
jgi:hypothetical protein